MDLRFLHDETNAEKSVTEAVLLGSAILGAIASTIYVGRVAYGAARHRRRKPKNKAVKNS